MLFIIVCEAAAQDHEYNLISPYQTLMTHVRFMEDDNYNPEFAARVFNPKRVGEKEGKKLATQLMQIYKGAGILIDFKDIPIDPNYLDSLTGRNIYVCFFT